MVNHSGNLLYEWDPVDEIEVEVIINKLETTKNSNTDRISAFLLKECILFSIKEITHLFNLILETSIFPDHWVRFIKNF